MLSYWSDFNKVTSKALQVQYVHTRLGTFNYRPVYECHRIATKSYAYIGMSEAAAKACQAAKLAQYTRNFFRFVNASGASEYTCEKRCVANISMDHDDGGLWTVDISVNEDQVQYYVGADFYNLDYTFLFDQTLDYDEDSPDGSMLRISAIFRQNARLYIRYQQAISGFARASLIVECSADSGATWTAATPTSHTDGEMYFNLGWTAGLYRLRWGTTIISNAEPTPASEPAGTITLSSPDYYAGAWCISYSKAIANFSPSGLDVFAKESGAAAWTDITAQCAITGNRITTPYSSEPVQVSFKAMFGDIASNTVNTPYNPDADTGDGSITVLGARLNTNGGDGYYEYILTTTVDTFNAANLTVKISADGITWTALTLTTPTESDGKIYGTFDTSTASLRYVKFFYSGVQASGAFATPYHAADDTTLYHLGMYPSAIPYIFYGQTIADFDVTNMALEESTDGGGTWSAVSLASSGHDATHLVLTNEPDASTPRLLRLVYDGSTISGNLKYPLA